MRRIHEFEALRGFLALWVVVGHVIKHCGRISYSIYLWHMFVILLVSAALLDGVKGISQFEHAAILIPSALALSTALSWLSFRIIEKPGMELGQRLARRMRAKGAEAVPQSA